MNAESDRNFMSKMHLYALNDIPPSPEDIERIRNIVVREVYRDMETQVQRSQRWQLRFGFACLICALVCLTVLYFSVASH